MAIEAVVALKAVGTVEKLVSPAMFAIDLQEIWPDRLQTQFFQLLEILLQRGPFSVHRRRLDLHVFFFGYGLIANVVALVAQIAAKETVIASLAVNAEVTVARSEAAVKETGEMAVDALHAFP